MPSSVPAAPVVVGPRVDAFAIGVHRAAAFFARFLGEVFRPPYHLREVLRQCYEVGYRSLSLITLTGFVVGVVFTEQSRPSLSSFGATSWLPSLVTVAVVRALAPLVTALICAGKIGSSIGAELGTMRVTEQIEAMEVSGINPFKYLVVTRVVAATLMVPLLAVYAGFVGLVGGYLNIHGNEGTTVAAFLESGFSTVEFLDVESALVKAFCYGLTIAVIGCYKGYHASRGTEGVGRAANSAVVAAMFAVFIEEAMIVQVTEWLRSR